MERQDLPKNQIDVIAPERRAQDIRALPSSQEIRRQLGWGLLMLEQKASVPRCS
jgi:hypothetical protein